MQPSRNHQVNDQPEIIIETNGYTLANPPEFADLISLSARKRWVGRAQQERTCQPHSMQRLPDNAALQRSHVSCDVGQFWHWL